MCKILARIQQIASAEGITISAMERTIGASKGVLSRAIANSTDIQSKWLMSIIENYPQYSGDWLLTGTGEMLKGKIIPTTTTQHDVESYKRSAPRQKEEIPIIPFSAMAGYLSGEMSINEEECAKLYIPGLKADFVIKISGNSMEPRYYDGDYVACEKTSLNDIFFEWDKVYVIDTDQGVLIKRVNPGTTVREILLESDNKKYRPIPMPTESIYHIALVKGVVRIE